MMPAFRRTAINVTVKLTDRSAPESFGPVIAGDPRLDLRPRREVDFYADQSRDDHRHPRRGTFYDHSGHRAVFGP
jgi:hypothetical protein